MNNCKKCGAPLLIGSKLCRKCGTLVDTPVKRICPKCKSEVSEGLIFCNKCGERLAPFAVGSMSGDSRMRTLTVSRDLSVLVYTPKGAESRDYEPCPECHH